MIFYCMSLRISSTCQGAEEKNIVFSVTHCDTVIDKKITFVSNFRVKDYLEDIYLIEFNLFV